MSEAQSNLVSIPVSTWSNQRDDSPWAVGRKDLNLVHFIFLWKLLSEAIICQLRSVHLITIIYGGDNTQCQILKG